MSHLANAYGFMDLGKGKKWRSKTAVLSPVRFAPKRREFFICQRVVAPSIVAARAALESGGVAQCGRLR
jgi:hypothetical protein